GHVVPRRHLVRARRGVAGHRPDTAHLPDHQDRHRRHRQREGAGRVRRGDPRLARGVRDPRHARGAGDGRDGLMSMNGERIEGRVGAEVPTKSVRVWRGFFAGIWLVYLVAPAASLFGHNHSGLYIAGGLTIVAAFCVVYIVVISCWERSPNSARLGFAALFVLASVASVAYHGNGAWIFVSAAAGLTIPSPRTALRVIGGGARLFTGTPPPPP